MDKPDGYIIPKGYRFKNTYRFRESAAFFEKNGIYTLAPKGTIQYREFWEQEHFRCMHGYEVDGVRITGAHYFYLNYTNLLAKDESTKRKRMLFPRFLDVDYEYFHIVELARKLEKGIILVKPRRTGFSYKNAALITHEYNFYRDSKCIIGSFRSIMSENTMKMVLDNLNFLDKNTEWVKPRNPDTRDFVKARHQVNIDGVRVWKGYNSEIQTLTYKDNPFASVGKTSSIFIFEEAGVFENLISSYNMTEPCWKDGDDMIGIPILFGTGGDMEGGTRDFAEMFYNPDRYNLLSFDNVWEPEKGGKCGWFVPAMRGRLGTLKVGTKELELKGELVDKDGNSNEGLAEDSINNLRETKKGDPKSYRDIVTQYPKNPSEAFLRVRGSVFPSAELQLWLSTVETTPALRSYGKHGDLIFDVDNKVKFSLNSDKKPISCYPYKADVDSKEGCVVIWEEPEIINGEVPSHLYLAGCDPYDQDKAESSESLGSIFIYKTFISANRTYNQPVAEFTGRPEYADDFYEICRKLCIYYNAKCLYENQLKGLKAYFQSKNSLHYLYDTPTILKDIVKNSEVHRGYGIHMNRGTNGATGIKDQCELYMKQWLMEERTDSNGIKILNLNTILSIPLLQELLAYDRELNTDRIIAFMLCILQSRENYRIKLNEANMNYKPDQFFSKNYFKKPKQHYNI